MTRGVEPSVSCMVGDQKNLTFVMAETSEKDEILGLHPFPVFKPLIRGIGIYSTGN